MSSPIKNRDSYMTSAAAISIVTLAGLAMPAVAQPVLDFNGETFDFNNTFVEREIPNLRGSIFRFTVIGADGGDAVNGVNDGCFNGGGQGAQAVIQTVIGLGTDRLPPDQKIRFIVGSAGAGSDRNQNAAGGGGGGSGIVYTRPGSGEVGDWRVLAVAGGGGGAFSSSNFGLCDRPDQDGIPGQAGTSGAGANDSSEDRLGRGGMNGQAGEGSETGFTDTNYANGGGGAFGNATIPDPDETSGRAAFDESGDPVGGSGVTMQDLWIDGGYGFGGGGGAREGGGGGGGGGYSGGGGGGSGRAGGGGGSYTEDAVAFGGVNFTTQGVPNLLNNGQIRYEFIGQAHDQQSAAIPFEVLDSGALSAIGTNLGATVSLINGISSVDADVWYTYTNTSACSQTLRFFNPGGAQLVFVATGQEPFASVVQSPSVVLESGDTLNLRIAPRFSSTFVVEGTVIQDVDTDLDSVCDRDDICDGIDDTTVDFSADVDSDGIPDRCDIACIADLWPDGEFTSQDTQQLVVTLAFGDPEEMLDLNFDGEFNYYDIVRFFEFCD